MQKIRALTDLNLGGFSVPYNRVAEVDDDVAADLIERGFATDDEKAVETGLIMNPETIELATPDGKKAKPKPPAEQAKAQAEAEAGQPKKGGKITSPPEDQTNVFGEAK
jgi:hypothetical protein